MVLLQADTRAKVIDSRSGSLFCHMCDDFVWDPTLEDLRNRKIDTGTFSSKTVFLLSLLTINVHAGLPSSRTVPVCPHAHHG